MGETVSKEFDTDESHRINDLDNYVRTITTVLESTDDEGHIGEVLTVVSDVFDDYDLTVVTLEHRGKSSSLDFGTNTDRLDYPEAMLKTLRELLKYN